jgi:hypothetical protein
MTQPDLDLTARYAVYERILEYLLANELIRTNPNQWEDIKKAIIGPSVVVSKGLIDLSDLEQVECHIHDRFEDIFGRAAVWAANTLK